MELYHILLEPERLRSNCRCLAFPRTVMMMMMEMMTMFSSATGNIACYILYNCEVLHSLNFSSNYTKMLVLIGASLQFKK